MQLCFLSNLCLSCPTSITNIYTTTNNGQQPTTIQKHSNNCNINKKQNQNKNKDNNDNNINNNNNCTSNTKTTATLCSFHVCCWGAQRSPLKDHQSVVIMRQVLQGECGWKSDEIGQTRHPDPVSGSGSSPKNMDEQDGRAWGLGFIGPPNVRKDEQMEQALSYVFQGNWGEFQRSMEV